MTDITIIVPTMDRETLRTAIDSVVEQTDPRWKLILAGDGKIPTRHVVDERISYWNFGYHTSAGLLRNFGVQKADTDWVAWLDDDDILFPEYVSQFYENRENADVLVYQMNNHGTWIPNPHVIAYGNIGVNFAAKRKLMLVEPFKNEREIGTNEDFEWANRVVQQNYRFKYLSYRGYFVRPHLYGVTNESTFP